MEDTKGDPSFVNLAPCNQDDIFIAVMGVTGAGKSSFIGQCCPHSEGIVGEDLDSFTKDCAKHTLTYKGRAVHLIDTPGFNDSTRRDTDVLLQVATWLAEAYRMKTRLNGLIYLHGIHDARMTGTDRVHLNMFKDLTGTENMKNVVLATSYWDVTPEAKGIDREKKLRENDKFWKTMEDRGATIMRFKNDSRSALAIIEHIVDLNKTTLEIQKEMSEQHKTVAQTAAGLTLDSEINKRVADATKDIEESKKSLEQAIKDKDEEAAQAALKHEDELKKQMIELAENKRALDKTTEELLKQKDEEIKKAREETERLKLEREKAMEEHKRELAAKDQESVRALEANDRAWDDAVSQAATELTTRLQFALEANERSTIQQQQQQQQPMSEERLELLIRRLIQDKENDTRGQPPPPYSPPAPPAMPPQQMPPPPPQQHSPDSSFVAAAAAGTAAAGVSLGALASAAMCNVM